MSRQRKFFWLLAATILTSLTLFIIILPRRAHTEVKGRWDPELSSNYQRVAAERARERGCLSCHAGIEVISELMQPFLLAMAGGKAGYECAVCHEGKPDAATKEEAHRGLLPNPSSMWVMSEGRGCAKCHSRKAALKTLMGKPMPRAAGGSIMSFESRLTDPSGATGGDHVYRMQRSLMALETGKANKILSSNGVIPKGSFPYSNFDMDDPDGSVPSAGSRAYKEWIAKALRAKLILRLEGTKSIPPYEEGKKVFGSPAKAAFADMHRKQCGRCHVWGEGRPRRGDFRAGGCAACHVLYTNDARYEGGDPTIPKDRAPHPMKHEITNKIPAAQCNHCHTRGKRIGTTYIGMFEYDYAGSGKAPPLDAEGNPQRLLYTKEYLTVRQDLHGERGMDCADCHTSIDVHGDGNIYPVTFYQVEVSCTDCHGTPTHYPWELPVGYGSPVLLEGPRGTYKSGGKEYLLTNRGNSKSNWVRKGFRAFVLGKYSGRKYEIPLLKNIKRADSWKTPQGRAAMGSISQHIDKLECYACHATWAPQCYGCHIKYDIRKQGTDWISSAMNRDPATGKQRLVKAPGDIRLENRGFLRWESPILGVNFRGKVAPLIPGCQVVWSFVDEKGKLWELNKINTTSDGLPAPTLAPVQPHSNTAAARTCEDCHTNPKAIGYGTAKSRSAGELEGDRPQFAGQAEGVFGDIPGSETAKPQVPMVEGFPYAWDQLVTRSGKQVQNMPLPADRPLSEAERKLTEREGVCIACHKHYNTPEWEKIVKKYGRALTPEEHDKVLEKMIKEMAR